MTEQNPLGVNSEELTPPPKSSGKLKRLIATIAGLALFATASGAIFYQMYFKAEPTEQAEATKVADSVLDSKTDKQKALLSAIDKTAKEAAEAAKKVETAKKTNEEINSAKQEAKPDEPKTTVKDQPDTAPSKDVASAEKTEEAIFGLDTPSEQETPKLNNKVLSAIVRGAKISFKKTQSQIGAPPQQGQPSSNLEGVDPELLKKVNEQLDPYKSPANLADRPALNLDRPQSDQLDPSYFIAAGTFIECALDNKIVSNYEGFTTCTTTSPVYSYDGKNLLLPRGTKVLGKYLVATASGENRLFISWETIRTPELFTFTFNRPESAVDYLGITGVQGRRDARFWERFGGSILISMLADVHSAALAYATKEASKEKSESSGAQIDYGVSSREAVSAAVNQVIEENASVRPTITLNQGRVIGLFLQDDLDLKSFRQRRLNKND